MDVSLDGLRRQVLGGAQPLRRRLTLLTMLAVVTTLVATSVIGWIALHITLLDLSERGSLLIAQDLAPLAREDLAATGRLGARALGPGSTVVEAVRAGGSVLRVPGEDLELVLGPREVTAAREQLQTVRTVTTTTGEAYRIVTLPLGGDGDAASVLVVGRPLAASDEVLHVFGVVVLSVGALGVFWAWFLSRAVAATALQPVRRFTDVVRHVAKTGDLHPVDAGGHTEGDLATLNDAFNQMLGRLAASRDQQNQLLADASHELRTPLTSMRTNVELLAIDARQQHLGDLVRTQIVDDVLAQTVELSALIADLVHLNRESTTTFHEPVEVAGLVHSAIERVRRRGPDLVFDVDVGPRELFGDAELLEQAVVNVLENAVKWSPPGSTVRIRLLGDQLRITDEGPGIADVDLPHVFDRFYRAESARSTPGTGLGLAIAAKILQDHRGAITAGRSRQGGAQLVIQLPAPTRPDAR